MTSVEFRPHPKLQPYVQLIWCFELDASADFGIPERIAPDGIVEVVFHYLDPMAMRFSGEDFVRQPQSSLVFQTRRFLEIQPSGTTGLVSVRLRPWGAYHFLPAPLSEISDQQVPAADVWGGAVTELEEKLARAPGAVERVGLVERFLLRRIHRHYKVEIEGLVRAVWSSSGDVRVPQLCQRLGLSERSAQRIFNDSLGMPPKSFLRLSRFLRACRLLRGQNWESLTQVGYDCGYYDQAHFAGDFRAFSGLTPKQFLDTQAFSFLEIE